MAFPAWLPRAAGLHADRPAIVTPEETLTYAELLARASGAAATLRANGIDEGDRVAIALPPGAAFAETLHACLLLGAIAVPIDARLTNAERSTRAADTDLLVAEPIDAGTAEPLRAERHD